MSQVLVTGATGFTGGHLVRRLVADGESVVALVRPGTDASGLSSLGVEIREADLVDNDAVREAFTSFSLVYHLAAAFRVEHPDRSVFRRVNVDGTRNVVEAARRAGVGRLVHCSTVGVQGVIEAPPADETYRSRPTDHYQATKLEGEELVLAAARDGLPATVVRPVGIYGPGDRRFLKLFRMIDSRRFVMVGDGNVLYHMTYVDDIVDGMVRAGRAPVANAEVFTLAGPEYTTLRHLVELIADKLGRSIPRWSLPIGPVYAAASFCEKVFPLVGKQPPLYHRRVDFFAHDRAFDCTKARRELGYDPQVDLDEGLERTIAWYRGEGWL